MIIFTTKVIFLKCLILMFFSLFWNVRIVKVDFMVSEKKNDNIKRNICTDKRINTSLRELSFVLNNHGRLGLLSFLSSLPISVLRNLEIDANNLYDGANNFYKAALLTRCYV